jgi:hypothetical protein
VEIADVKALMKRLRLDEAELPGNYAPSNPDAGAYLPTPNKLRDDIGAGLDAKALIRTFLNEVSDHWDTLSTVGLAHLETIESQAIAARNGPVFPIPGFRVKYEPLPFRLGLDVASPGRGGSVGAREIVTARDSRLDALLDRVTDTPEHAAQAVMALRQFDDALIRVLAARKAADTTGHIAEVLTIYREEGNLCVFPSKSSLDAGIPSAAPLDHKGRPERTFIKLIFRPNIQHLVYLAGKAEAEHAAGASSIEGLALATVFFTQTIGSDVIGGKWNPVDESRLIDFYGRWSAENRVACAMTDETVNNAAVEGRDRWDTLKENLSITELPGPAAGDPPALRVDPVDPVELLAGVLPDGVAFKRALVDIDEVFGRPAPTVRENLAAMRYNLQTNPDWALAVMISAVLSVSSGRSSSALRQAVASEPRLKPVIKLAREKLKAAKAYNRRHPELTPQQKNDNLSNAQAEAGKAPDFLDWLLSGNRLQVMELFLATAPYGPWKGYRGPRSYGWHHRRLKDFYERVFPGE